MPMDRSRAAGVTLTYFKKYGEHVKAHMAPEVRRAFDVACNILSDEAYKNDNDKDHLIKITLDKVESQRARDFMNKHYEKCNTSTNPFHSNVRFHFITEGTGIGNDISIKCMKCKKKENITNIESW